MSPAANSTSALQMSSAASSQSATLPPTPQHFDLETRLVSLVDNLHCACLDYPTFGSPQQGLVRLLHRSTRSGDRSWINLVKKEMGSNNVEENCCCWTARKVAVKSIASPRGIVSSGLYLV